MATDFELITEEFREDCAAIRVLVSNFDDLRQLAKTRVAAANSATLLVAATFEEYIRQLARQYAKEVVRNAASLDQLPPAMLTAAWKRTMEGLAKIKFESSQFNVSNGNIFGVAQNRFTVIYEFFRGDLTQDIYQDLIHNENNMRATEINGLFRVSGLINICLMSSDKAPLLEYLGEIEKGKAHGKLLNSLDEFFDRRNKIAHALNLRQSSGPSQIKSDLDMFECFASAITETLNCSTAWPLDVGAIKVVHKI